MEEQAHYPDDGTTSPARDLLAAARFGIPELPDFHVQRRRLVDQLARAGSVPLVLVSAPAGTGKTSLVAEWLRRRGPGSGTAGWITFDDGDTAFWSFLIDCLTRLGLDLPVRSSDVSMDTTLGPRRLAAMVDAVATAPEPLTVVVDGYEMVSSELAREVDLLLRHTFGRLRLVFIGRVDPVLPLYRYRLADTLREIRVADLAFSDDEAAQLLRALSVTLSPESVHELNQRTKGWAAGLRFAGRILAGRDDPGESVATVVAQAGDINEYLVGEVLDTQTPETRRFLLRTCVPDLLWPELAEQLAGPTSGHALGELSKSNAFIEPVTDPPGGYRYYPFFRDLLRAQLAYEEPQTMVDLHRTSARFFLRQGLPDLAFGHLVAIGAWGEVAAHIVDAHLVGRLLVEPPNGALRSLAEQLPDELEQPAACVVRAALALAAGDSDGCAAELSRAGREAGGTGRQADALVVSMAVLDAVRARFTEDADSAARLAQEAVLATSPRHGAPAPASDSVLPALAALASGVAALRLGDLGAARTSLEAALADDAASAYGAFRAECLGYLALVEALDGHLWSASRTATESSTVAADAGLAPVDRSPAAYVALAGVALEQYDLDATRRHIGSAMTCRALPEDPVSRTLAACVLAALERVDGHLQPALDRLESASRAAGGDPWLDRYLRLESARLSIASGEAELTLSTLARLDQQDDPEVAVLLAAAYAEQGQDAAVQQCLASVRTGEVPLRVRVAGLLVDGVRESQHRSPARSRDLLGRSMRLAAPEALRRPFREASPMVQRVLAADLRLLHKNRWLDQVGEPRQRTPDGHDGPAERGPGDQEPEVVEALTARELEVLRHLEELLTTEEIAEKMFVSVNTVRTHVRSILRKLGVSRRNAAVRRARRLGLVRG